MMTEELEVLIKDLDNFFLEREPKFDDLLKVFVCYAALAANKIHMNKETFVNFCKIAYEHDASLQQTELQ